MRMAFIVEELFLHREPRANLHTRFCVRVPRRLGNGGVVAEEVMRCQ